MSTIEIRPASECRFDILSLGEVMLRLDPGEGRVRTARTFKAWEGYITGKNIELEPYARIVQSWRSSNFEDSESDSQIEVLLSENGEETTLTLKHTNVPESGEHYKDGWNKHYFEPMQHYFEALNKG